MSFLFLFQMLSFINHQLLERIGNFKQAFDMKIPSNPAQEFLWLNDVSALNFLFDLNLLVDIINKQIGFRIMKINELNEVITEIDFKNYLSYFSKKKNETERYALYTDYAKEFNCSTEEAKDKILKQVFSSYIKKSLKDALDSANNNDSNAFTIITKLEELKTIFKDYDINSFSSFISSVEKELTPTNSELLFSENFISDDFLNSITSNIIKSISNLISKPTNTLEFLKAFNNHPLLYCLKESSELDMVISYIDDGTLDVGKYRQLIQMVLNTKNKSNEEAVDFFVTFLATEDISKGFYNICNDDNYKPEVLRNLLLSVIKGEPIYKNELDHAIKIISDLKVTVKYDYSGKPVYDNQSGGTLNDSGCLVDLDNGQSFFLHIHTAQGKGENQNGQQATTMKAFYLEKQPAISYTYIKTNVGKDSHGNDFCAQIGLHLTDKEKVFLSNIQFETDALKFLINLPNYSDLNEAYFLSSNLRIIKDSVKDSIEYNNTHLNLSDYELIKNKSQLYVGFLNKHADILKKLFENTNSEMGTSSQVASVPILKSIELLLRFEKKIEVLFNETQYQSLFNIFSEMKISKSNEVDDIKNRILDLLNSEKKDRNINVEKYNKFNDVLECQIKTIPKRVEKIIKEPKPNFYRLNKVKDKIKASSKSYNDWLPILNILDRRDFIFSDGNYSNSNSVQYSIARSVKYLDEKKDSISKGVVYNNHLEMLNLVCEYAQLRGRKIMCGSVDFTNKYKP